MNHGRAVASTSSSKVELTPTPRLVASSVADSSTLFHLILTLDRLDVRSAPTELVKYAGVPLMVGENPYCIPNVASAVRMIGPVRSTFRCCVSIVVLTNPTASV